MCSFFWLLASCFFCLLWVRNLQCCPMNPKSLRCFALAEQPIGSPGNAAIELRSGNYHNMIQCDTCYITDGCCGLFLPFCNHLTIGKSQHGNFRNLDRSLKSSPRPVWVPPPKTILARSKPMKTKIWRKNL